MPSRGVFGIEVLKSIEMKNGLHFSPRRVGKWTLEEEHFAKNLIDQFEAGTLTDCQAGTTLRCYLSKRLNCDPMRISKKFAGKSIGKHTYVSRLRDLPPQSIPSPTTIPVPVPDLDIQSMGLVSQAPSDSLPPVSAVSQVPSSTIPIPSNISIPIIEEKENKKKLQTVVSFDTFTKYHKVQLEESLKPSNHKEYSNWPGYDDTTTNTTGNDTSNNMNISMKKRPFEEAFPCLPDVDVHTTATASTTSDVGLSIDEEDDEYDHRTVKKQVVQVPSTGGMEVTPYIPPTTATYKPIPITWVPVPVIPKQPLNDPSAGKQFTPVSTVPRWDAPLATWEQQGIGALATPTAMLSSGATGGIAFMVSPSAAESAAIATTTALPVVNFPACSIAQNTTTATLQAVPAAIPCTIPDNTYETETENMTGTETETGSQTGLLSETMTETGSQIGLLTETTTESDYNTGTETGYYTETDAATDISNTNTTDIDNKGWNDVLDILLLEEISPVVDTSLYRNSSLTSFNL